MPANRRKIYRISRRPATAQTAKASLKSRYFVVGIILLCVAGVLQISKFFLLGNSLRLDEAQSLWQTSHTLSGTLKVVAQDVHVPLYHIILHFWQFYFGQGIMTARLLSLLFFLATIPVVYLLARRVLSVNWALVTVVLFSFSPFMNWYANEARMYTLLAFVATLSQYFFLKIIQDKGKKGWLGYTITTLIGVYTHYFFIFNLLAQGIYFLLNRRDFARGTFKKLVFLAIGAIGVLVPWIYYFVSLGAASNTSPSLSDPSTVDFFNAFSNISFGFQTDAINTVLLSMWPLLVIVSLLAVKQGQKVSLAMGYLLAAGLLPIVLAYGLSYFVTPFFVSRYMVSCVAPLIIVGVWFVSNYGKRWSRAVIASLVVVLAVMSYLQYTKDTTPVKEDYRSAAEQISLQASSQDAVVLAAPFTVYPFDYYYDGPANVTTLPNWNRSVPGPVPPFDAAKLPSEVEALERDHTNVYLLLSYDQGNEEEIFQYFQQRYTQVRHEQYSVDVNLYVYKVGYDEVIPIDELEARQAL